jgi:probable HAF family extracellular repeat protein
MTFQPVHFAVKVAIATTLSLVAPQVAQAASFTPLGNLLGGFLASEATGVSADGSVVVGVTSSSARGYEAFRWTQADGIVGLGNLTDSTSRYSEATGVAADGSVVVGRGYGASRFEAFRWTPSGGMVGLGDLIGGDFYSSAVGVSADGSVVIGNSSSASSGPSADSRYEAFRWTPSGGMAGLGDLPGGIFYSYASSVSADGSVVVGYGNSANGYEAFRWTQSDGMVGLGDLPGGLFYGYASSVSADGSVVVGGSYNASRYEAFRWTQSDGMVGLGGLPGANLSYARGVSADGSVVVGQSRNASGDEAFVWNATEGMSSLQSLLASAGVSNLTGWQLEYASAVSANGRTIVGSGRNPSGNIEAWIAQLDPPTAVPTPALLPGLISFGLGIWRRRRSADI